MAVVKIIAHFFGFTKKEKKVWWLMLTIIKKVGGGGFDGRRPVSLGHS